MYPKVQDHFTDHFIRYDLDALFVVTHAPGQSAYNVVERRMAPLSHDLAGLILPHDHYGSHLDKQLRCIDTTLEKRNFSKAGHVLAEVWSRTVIDKEPVIAEYIEPEEVCPSPRLMSEQWKSVHIRASQYLLQIVKCNDIQCCKPRRSTISNVLPNRFIPSPVKYGKNEQGVFMASIDNDSAHYGSLSDRALLSSFIPVDMLFDRYCPSVQDNLHKRTCGRCSIYHCSASALTLHKRTGCLAKSVSEEKLTIECDIDDQEENLPSEPEFDDNPDDSVPIISIETYTTPLFVECSE